MCRYSKVKSDYSFLEKTVRSQTARKALQSCVVRKVLRIQRTFRNVRVCGAAQFKKLDNAKHTSSFLNNPAFLRNERCDLASQYIRMYYADIHCETRPNYSLFKKLDTHFHTIHLFELHNPVKPDISKSSLYHRHFPNHMTLQRFLDRLALHSIFKEQII